MNKHGVVYINISGQLKYWKETKCRWQSLCRKKKYLPCLQKHYLNPSDVPSLKGLRVNILSPHSCSSLCFSPYELFSSCLLTPPSPALESGSMWDSSECWASCLQLWLQFHSFLYCHCVDVASVTSVIYMYQNRPLCSLVSTLSLPSMLALDV